MPDRPDRTRTAVLRRPFDLGEHFPIFADDPEGVREWFAGYRATNMRLFTYPRPVIAAVNGHTFAGGLVTAGVCDKRIAAAGDFRFSLNEVLIGIPMPAVYVRLLGYAWGEQVSARLSLFGETFSTQQALDLGVLNEVVPADQLLAHAVAAADSIPEDCIEQYAFTKRAAQASALRDITDLSDPLDRELGHWFTTDAARHAHRRYWQQLKGTPAPW